MQGIFKNINLAYKQLASLQHVGQNCKNQQQLLLDEKTYQIIDDKVEYEKSMLFWSWGEKESAKMQMAHLIKKITKYGSEILPEALRVMGSWLWTLKSEGIYLQLQYYSVCSLSFKFGETKFDRIFTSNEALRN